MEERQPSIDNWDDFSGEYLKVENVEKFPLEVVPVNVSAIFLEGKPKLTMDFLFKERNRKMSLNRTNQDFIKRKGLAPKAIIGKKLVIDKCKVRNPSTNTMVDSFLIIDIV